MEYKIVTVYNHNVVLAAEESGKQLIIISKGVGFGKKTGDYIRAEEVDKKVFYILDQNANQTEINQLSHDLEKIELVTKEIVTIAKEKLDVENEKLFDALLDHITFAIQRLKMGLSIENPFMSEIEVLYSKEYEVAEMAANLIYERLEMNIGSSEKGFIALHLYSAKKSNHIHTTMKNTRVYSEIIEVLCKRYKNNADTQTLECKILLLSLKNLICIATSNRTVDMPIKQYVKLNMKLYYNLALDISAKIEKEMNVKMQENEIAFLTIELYKFIQM